MPSLTLGICLVFCSLGWSAIRNITTTLPVYAPHVACNVISTRVHLKPRVRICIPSLPPPPPLTNHAPRAQHPTARHSTAHRVCHAGATGGQLQSVLMRPTSQLSVKTCGGGGVGGRVGGGYWQLGGGGSQGGGGGCARPTTTTCIPQGCVCVWGHGGIEVCM